MPHSTPDDSSDSESVDSPSEELIEKVREIQVGILTRAFDRTSAYVNLLIVAGYAGAFAIWGFTNEDMTSRGRAAIALFLTVSLALYVIWEVYLMLFITKYTFRQRDVLVKSLPPKEFLAAINELQQQSDHETVKNLIPLWRIAFALIVASALIAFALLAYSFLSTLLAWPQWP